MARQYRSYFLWILASTVAFLACAALVGAIVDPYGITGWLTVKGFNERKPRQVEQARIAKPIHAARGNFDVFIFGTSQVEQGFNPADPRLGSLRAYNLGLSELRLHEAAGLIDFLGRNTNAKTVLISLDFLRYNSPVAGNPFLPAPAELGWIWIARRLAETFLSFQSLQDSWQTIRWNRLAKGDVLRHDDLGWLDINSGPALPDQKTRFDQVDKATFDETDYLGLTASRAEHLRNSGFDHADLSRIVNLATARQLNVVFFVAPRHARQHEILHLVGLLPLFAQWRAEIACIVTPRFKLWDFSGYNDVTVDDRLWSDTVHFESAVGTAILDRTLGLALPEFRDKKFGRIVDVGGAPDWSPDAQYSDKALRYEQHIAEIYKEKGIPKPVSLDWNFHSRCKERHSIMKPELGNRTIL